MFEILKQKEIKKMSNLNNIQIIIIRKIRIFKYIPTYFLKSWCLEVKFIKLSLSLKKILIRKKIVNFRN